MADFYTKGLFGDGQLKEIPDDFKPSQQITVSSIEGIPTTPTPQNNDIQRALNSPRRTSSGGRGRREERARNEALERARKEAEEKARIQEQLRKKAERRDKIFKEVYDNKRPTSINQQVQLKREFESKLQGEPQTYINVNSGLSTKKDFEGVPLNQVVDISRKRAEDDIKLKEDLLRKFREAPKTPVTNADLVLSNKKVVEVGNNVFAYQNPDGSLEYLDPQTQASRMTLKRMSKGSPSITASFSSAVDSTVKKIEEKTFNTIGIGEDSILRYNTGISVGDSLLFSAFSPLMSSGTAGTTQKRKTFSEIAQEQLGKQPSREAVKEQIKKLSKTELKRFRDTQRNNILKSDMSQREKELALLRLDATILESKTNTALFTESGLIDARAYQNLRNSIVQKQQPKSTIEIFIETPPEMKGLGSLTSTATRQESLTPNREVQFLATPQLQQQKQTPFLVSGQKPQQKTAQNLFLSSGLQAGQKTGQLSKQSFNFLQAQSQIQKQRTKQTQTQIQKQRTTTKPQPRPKIKNPLLPKLKSDYVPRRKKKKLFGGEWFTPEIRRFGKWRPLGRFSSFKEAKQKGVSNLRSTLSASLRVRKGKEIIPFVRASKEFRGAKKNPLSVLVQRRGKRLSSLGEVREINFFRRSKS